MYLLKDEHAAPVAKAAETAIRRGGELLDWWNSARPTMAPIKHNHPDVTMEAFFHPMRVEGAERPGMGCLQTTRFHRSPLADSRPPVDLREWLLENAVKECYRPSRLGRGFLYRPLLVKRADGFVERFPAGLSVRMADIGQEFQWAVLRLDMPDYARAFPLPEFLCRFMKLFMTESGSVVFHPQFFRSGRPPVPGAVASVCFGYGVVPWKISPTILGFGPGRFFSAFKQYRVCLMEDSSVLVEVVFVVCPRSEMILDIGGLDPVYGTVRLLNALTFKRTRIEPKVHMAIDSYAMGHHGRVHVNMLEGLRDLFEATNWTARPEDHVNLASPKEQLA
jgi:hypothetical protein